MGWRRGMALSQDMRDRVLAAPGLSRDVALRFGVSVSYVVKVRARLRDEGDAAAGLQRNRVPARLAGHEDALRAEVARRPSASCDDLRVWAAARGVALGRTAVWNTLTRLGLTLKKKQVRAAEQDRADVAEASRAWVAAAPALEASRLVFLDETWANMAPRYGRAPRGERALDAVPHGHWKTTTFGGAMRAEGFVAPLVLDGAINGTTFRAYVEQMLAPALRPGDTVVMDNLSSHKVAGVREAIEAVGARLLYLPPYNPDFNPIEMAFSKLKTLLRREAHRTQDALWHGIGQLLDHFPPNECHRYLAHCGYRQSK